MRALLIGMTLITSVASFAADSYNCQVMGVFTNYDDQSVEVYQKNLSVEVDSNESVLFGAEEGQMPWAISIRNMRDGGENPLVLTVRAPNQNASIGRAYSEKGSKYIGFIQGSNFEALCVKK